MRTMRLLMVMVSMVLMCDMVCADPPRLTAKKTPVMAMLPTPVANVEYIEAPSDEPAVQQDVIAISTKVVKQETCACGTNCPCTIEPPKPEVRQAAPPVQAVMYDYDEAPTHRLRLGRRTRGGTCSGGGCQ